MLSCPPGRYVRTLTSMTQEEEDTPEEDTREGSRTLARRLASLKNMTQETGRTVAVEVDRMEEEDTPRHRGLDRVGLRRQHERRPSLLLPLPSLRHQHPKSTCLTLTTTSSSLPPLPSLSPPCPRPTLMVSRVTRARARRDADPCARSLPDDFDDFQSATPAAAPAPAAAQPAKANQNVFDLLNAQPARPTMAPATAAPQPAMTSYAPMQARPAMQAQTSSFASTTPAAVASKPATAPASDFSDLFGSFGGAGAKPAAGAGGAGGQPKLTIAQMQAQKREQSLFAAPSASANGGGGASQASGWDSLL